MVINTNKTVRSEHAVVIVVKNKQNNFQKKYHLNCERYTFHPNGFICTSITRDRIHQRRNSQNMCNTFNAWIDLCQCQE